ncbi:hypothetical protein BC829DRAFT_71558 [Chytridium lagenaria]|nr:hypothetical protein BC829DRAFT_71558 [Chytridium lagenaria]
MTDASRHVFEAIERWSLKDTRYKSFSSQPFLMRSMKERRISDLSIRLNIPYLLVHQNACEHTWKITSMRMKHSRDDTSPANYPLCLSEPLLNRRNAFFAKVIIQCM